MVGQEVPIGVSVEQAGSIATKNAVSIAIGSAVVFFLIYRFLIK